MRSSSGCRKISAIFGFRSLEVADLIQCDPKVMMGKPVVRGTRIAVEQILGKLAAGETMEQILAAHPRSTREAVFAAIEFAAHALRADVVYPVSAA
jgi:uncharacterized protein (DUF433 family)